MKHGVDLSVLEACLSVAFVLVSQIGVLVHADEGAASQIEVFDHQLSEAIVGIVHFVVEEKGQVELFVDEAHEVIHPVGVDIAQHAFAVEKGGRRGIDLMLFQNLLEVLQVRNVTSGQRVCISQFEQMLMLCVRGDSPVMVGCKLIFSNNFASFLE